MSNDKLKQIIAGMVRDFARDGCDMNADKEHFCEQFGCSSFEELAQQIEGLSVSDTFTITTGQITSSTNLTL